MPLMRAFASSRPRGRLEAHHVALSHAESLGVRSRELDPGVRRGPLELRGAGGFGAGMEVVDRTACGVSERILIAWLLVRWLVLGGEKERPPGGRERPVLRLRALRARQEVTAIGLAVIRLRIEVAVGVEALGAEMPARFAAQGPRRPGIKCS